MNGTALGEGLCWWGKSIGWWGRQCVQILCAAAVGARGVFAAPCANVALLSVQLAQQFEVDGLQAAASLGNLRSYSVHVVEHLRCGVLHNVGLS